MKQFLLLAITSFSLAAHAQEEESRYLCQTSPEDPDKNIVVFAFDYLDYTAGVYPRATRESWEGKVIHLEGVEGKGVKYYLYFPAATEGELAGIDIAAVIDTQDSGAAQYSYALIKNIEGTKAPYYIQGPRKLHCAPMSTALRMLEEHKSKR